MAYWTIIAVILSSMGFLFLILKHNRLFVLSTLLAFLIWLGYTIYGAFFYRSTYFM